MTDPKSDARPVEGAEPCPFCGSPDLGVVGDVWGRWNLECTLCMTQGPSAGGEAEAIKSWNVRAGRPQRRALEAQVADLEARVGELAARLVKLALAANDVVWEPKYPPGPLYPHGLRASVNTHYLDALKACLKGEP